MCRLAKSPGGDPSNKGIQQVFTLLQKYLNLHGDYVEKYFNVDTNMLK
jgi:hypothetical protein